MPEETTIRPSPVVTSEAPTPRISAGEIAGPYQRLANSLDKLGQGLENVAVPLSEKAGAQAVSLDAQGNIQVEPHWPIFGEAGKTYANAMKMAALAQGEGAAKRADIALADQYRGNPEAYQNAAQAYKDKTIQQYTAAAGPEVGVELGRAIDSVTTYTFRGLVNEKRKLDLRIAENEISLGMADARNTLMALSRKGDVGVEQSQAWKDALDKYNTLSDKKTRNPEFAYDQTQRAYDLQQLQDDINGQRYVHHVSETYKEKGYRDALEDANSIFTDPRYHFDMKQRASIHAEATADIHSQEAVRHQDVQAAHAAMHELGALKAGGQQIDPQVANKVRQNLVDLKDPNGVATFDMMFSHGSLNDAHGLRPLHQQNEDLALLQGAPRWKAAYDLAIAHGLTAPQAAGFVGGLRGETETLNPRQVHDNGIGLGIAGWNKDRLQALRDFAAKNNMSVVDTRTQIEFAFHELQTSEFAAGNQLRNAKTSDEAAQAMLNYLRPANYNVPGAHSERAEYARAAYQAFGGGGEGEASIFGGSRGEPLSRAAGKPQLSMLLQNRGPAVASWFLMQRAQETNKAARAQLAEVTKEYIDKAGQRPSNEFMMDVLETARLTGDIDLQSRVKNLSATIGLVDQLAGLPIDEQQQRETAILQQLRAGNAPTGAEENYKLFAARTKAIEEGIKNSPIATTVANVKGVTDPGPFDWNNPALSMQKRAKIARIGENTWKVPMGILDKTDLDRMTAEMRGQNAPAILGAVKTLDADAQQALLRQEEFRSAVTGASRSGDPAKMNAAYSYMDTLQRQNPLVFDKQFENSLADLRAWQKNLSFYPPDEAAKMMMKANDPSQAAARRASDEVANKALEKFSPANVVSKFSTGFLMFGTKAQTPSGEQAGIAAGALKADYDQNFKEGFARTGDANMADAFAMEKLNLKYGMSPSNSNRVMAYPPERYYPQVGGSHDWMAKQLDDELAHHLGVSAGMPPLERGFEAAVEPTALYARGQTPAERQYGAARALVSDDTTQSDIAAGRPPSYQVVIQDPNGRWGVLTNTTGAVQRFRFDPAGAFAARAAEAERVRPTVQLLQQQAPAAVTP
jgi:hypothetical protein